MARIRTIKPEFPQSQSMGRVSRDARLLFILLWTLVDDEGRARGSSRMLASLLFPYDADAPDQIEGWLVELEGEKCIERYQVDGNDYVQIRKWTDHQKIDRPSKSRLPGSRGLAKPRECSSGDLDLDQDHGPRTKDRGPGTVDHLDGRMDGGSRTGHQNGEGVRSRGTEPAGAVAARIAAGGRA